MKEMPRSVREASELLRTRKLSALELADLALERSHRDRYNAWLHLSDDHARENAWERRTHHYRLPAPLKMISMEPSVRRTYS